MSVMKEKGLRKIMSIDLGHNKEPAVMITGWFDEVSGMYFLNSPKIMYATPAQQIDNPEDLR